MIQIDPNVPSDPALAALGSTSDGEDRPRGLSGWLLNALEVVIPPSIGVALLSPLMTLEALIAALAQSGQALLIPTVLLIIGFVWVYYERRLALLLAAARRRKSEGATT